MGFATVSSRQRRRLLTLGRNYELEARVVVSILHIRKLVFCTQATQDPID